MKARIAPMICTLFMCTVLLSGVPAAWAGPDNASTGKSNLVITTNWGQDTCSLVDVKNLKELAVINCGLKPYDIKASPNGRFAYVTSSGSAELLIVDLQAMLVSDSIKVGESPRDVSITRNGKRAVVANAGDDSISVIDLEKKQEIYKVKVGSMPYGVGLAMKDRRAVISCWGSNEVYIVDLGEKEGTVSSILKVGVLPYTVAVAEPGDYAIVTCFGSHQIFPIDLNTLKVLEPVNVGRSPWGLDITPDGKQALVANFYSGDASLLNIANAKLKSATPVVEAERINLRSKLKSGDTEGRVKNSAISDDGETAVLSDLANNRLFILNMKDKSLAGMVAVGKAPYGIAFIPRPNS